ncbi:MAG: iron-sulfur cluster assembly scaffold protein [Patescibacteria group bacterium]|nr:iron-sulfur cluster assembly scaffold protein [Patescibacteria group bacterium]
MNLYSELILDHYRYPRNFGRLDQPTHFSQAANPFCGDELAVYLMVSGSKIQKIKFSGKGCALSIASASMVTEFLKGKSVSYLKKVTKDFIIKMLGIEIGPTRLKCALLILEAVSRLKVSSNK